MSGSQGGKGSEEGTPKKIKLRRTLQMGAESHFGEGHGLQQQSQSAQLALAAPASATGAAQIDLAAVPPQAVPTPPEKSAAAPPEKSAAADPATSHNPAAPAVPPPPSAAVAQTASPISPFKESWAWEYFEPAPGEPKTPRTKAVRVKCRICGKILSRGVRRATTTSMLRHLISMHEITGPATATSEPAKKKKKLAAAQSTVAVVAQAARSPLSPHQRGGRRAAPRILAAGNATSPMTSSPKSATYATLRWLGAANTTAWSGGTRGWPICGSITPPNGINI